jgi:beta-barrel assembly-enhancing protease
MKLKNQHHYPLWITALLMLSLVPLNMGGCAGGGGGGLVGIGHAVGSAVGGTTGNLIKAGGTGLEAATLNESHERALGQSVAVAVTARHPPTTDLALNKYVGLVGLTIASVTAQPDANWVFGVLESDEVNAFSGPSGYVMITRGALRQMQDESELAGVLAHEVAHVVHKHGLEAVKAAGIKKAGVQAATASDETGQFTSMADGVTDVVLGGFGQKEETIADQTAVTYMIRAGYDPNGYARFLDRMGQAQKSAGPRFLSSHPGAANRASNVRAKATEKGATGGATLAERFKKHVR